MWTALCGWRVGVSSEQFNKLRWTVRTFLTSWATSSFQTRILVDRFRSSFTTICWRHIMSVSTQTDLLEKCRVNVYTNRFAEEMSRQCLHKPIWWRNVVSVSTRTDLLEKCHLCLHKHLLEKSRVSVYTNRFVGKMSFVSTQTYLLEKCCVSVYTNQFAGDMSCQCLHRRSNGKRESPCVHIWRKNYLTY
jgi:hypothetical protein